MVTDLSTGAQPWSTTINAGAYDPFTGDVIIGNIGGLYRLASGTSVGTLIVGNLGGYLSNVQFDPSTGDILATVLQANRLIRVDGAGVVTDLMSPGSVTGPNALQVDSLGNYLLGGASGRVEGAWQAICLRQYFRGSGGQGWPEGLLELADISAALHQWRARRRL